MQGALSIVDVDLSESRLGADGFNNFPYYPPVLGHHAFPNCGFDDFGVFKGRLNHSVYGVPLLGSDGVIREREQSEEHYEARIKTEFEAQAMRKFLE